MKYDSKSITGPYYDYLNKKVSKIENHSKTNKIRRIISLLLIISICAGGIWIGISDRSSKIENQYQEYVDSKQLDLRILQMIPIS